MTKYNRIPLLKDVSEWMNIEISGSSEKLIGLSALSPRITVKSMYYHLGFPGSLDDCYCRETVAGMLIRAAQMLPRGKKLVIYDGWRPFVVQEGIYRYYLDEVQELSRKTGQPVSAFVSEPSVDKKKPAPHITGGSVDLSIVDEFGKELDMGAQFDEFIPKSFTRYYEEKTECGEVLNQREHECLENRRMLFHVMSAAGFTNYCFEWWHFDYGNQFWGAITGKKAIYGVTILYGS